MPPGQASAALHLAQRLQAAVIGEGVHRVCLRSNDLQRDLVALAAAEAEMIDAEPRPGADGSVAFIHSRTLNGVLWELLDPGSEMQHR